MPSLTSATKTKKLAGRVAIVTGASRGIGRAIALALGEAGADLALVSRDTTTLNGVSEEAKKSGVISEVFTADVSNELDVERLRITVINRFGEVNILVNSAGVNIRKPLTARAGWNVEACYGNIDTRQAFSPSTSMNIVAQAA